MRNLCVAALSTSTAEREEISTCEVYGLPLGEAVRRVTWLRRRWPHEAPPRRLHLPPPTGSALEDAARKPARGGRAAASTEAQFGSAASFAASDISSTSVATTLTTSSLSDAYSLRNADSRRGPDDVGGQRAAGCCASGAALRDTLKALRVAATLQEDASGRCWPGGEPMSTVQTAVDPLGVSGRPTRVRARVARDGAAAIALEVDALYGLLGCEDELEA